MSPSKPVKLPMQERGASVATPSETAPKPPDFALWATPRSPSPFLPVLEHRASWRRRVTEPRNAAGRFRGLVGPALLCLAVLLYAMAFQGSRGLWERDEGRYANIALQMLRSGDFLKPAFNDDVHHFAKPPLTYWAVAAGISLLGRNGWGARLPNTLAFIGTILVLYALGKGITPQKPWLPALVYGSSLLPFGAANFVTTDTLLTFWEALAVFGFVLWRSRSEHPSLPLILMWLGFALAFLTKGPPGLLPLLAIAGLVFFQDGWRGLPPLATPSGLAVFTVLGLGWYLIVVAIDPRLAGYFLKDEVIGRVASGASFNRNASWYGPFVVYVPTLIAGTLPWTLVLLRKVRSVPGTLLSRRWWRVKLFEDPWGLFLLLWLLIPLCVFFVSRSRLPLYLLPLFVHRLMGLLTQSGFDVADVAEVGKWSFISRKGEFHRRQGTPVALLETPPVENRERVTTK